MKEKMKYNGDLLGVLVADPGLVDQHPDAAGGVGLGQLGQVLAVLGVRLETHLGQKYKSIYLISHLLHFPLYISYDNISLLT